MQKLLAAFGLLLCVAAADADVLHLKDGSRVQGKLTFCDEEVCSIDKRRIPLIDIARIELRDDEAWRACLEDAECRGVPPDCGPEPSLAGAHDN